MTRYAPLILMAACLAALAGPAPAEPVSTLLEKAIYTEETAGDLDAAIKLYQQIIQAAEADRSFLAQAHYRLGMCLLKKGRQDEAIAAFEKVKDRFADQKDIAAQAGQQLKKLGHGVPKPLSLEPAPWPDGELMRLRLVSMAGADIGTILYTARAAQAGARKTWLLESTMFISLTNMLQYTRVEADRDTFAPVTGRTYNSEMGDYRASYQPDKVKLTALSKGKETSRTFDLDKPVYDNEQVLQMLRRLPLAPGYRTSFWIFPVMGGSIVECRIEVTGKEKVTVPAGTWECHKMTLSVWEGTTRELEHHLWFSADARRCLVKYDSCSALMELVELSTPPADKPVPVALPAMGVSLTLPAGWSYHPYHSTHELVQLLPPDVETWAVLAISRGFIEGLSPRQVAEMDTQVLYGYFKNYKVRADSWKDVEVAGLPGARFVADYEDDGTAKVEYRTYLVGKPGVHWFVFRIDKARFAKARPVYDAIMASLKIQEPASAPAKPSSTRAAP